MSDIPRNESPASSESSIYDGPASPTLVDTPLEEFPLTQPGIFTLHPRHPRLLTPAPIAPIPLGPPTVTNHLLTLGQMSPQSIHTAIASHNLPANTYRSIINGLIITSEARTHHHQQELASQEEDHKKKLDDRNETIEFMEAHLVGYIDTFLQPPQGYVENSCLTTFTIPCGNRLSNPAKLVKKLDDSRVTGYSSEDGPHDLPHVCEIYTSPKYMADPAEPLPHWIHETLQGPAPGYAALLDAVKATDDWGLEADVMHFRTLDERVIAYKAQLDRTHGELKSTIIARDQCQGHLECAQLSKWISHLAGEPSCMPTNRQAQGGWKEGRGHHFQGGM